MKNSKILSKAKNIIILVMVGLLAIVTVLPVFAASNYSYIDSVVSLSGYTYGPDFLNDNYWHTGYTYGSQYPGVPFSSIRVRVTSFDVADGGANYCNDRTTDSGDVYGYSVQRRTDDASVFPCTGSFSHEYYGRTEHYYGGSYYTTTNTP